MSFSPWKLSLTPLLHLYYVNERHHRTGTPGEGLYKACPVFDDQSLLGCHRYIELNPLRVRMVADPAEYRWSGHRGYTRTDPDPLVSPHRAWQALGSDLPARQRAWRALVKDTVDGAETDAFRLHLQRQPLYGPDRFRRAIEG